MRFLRPLGAANNPNNSKESVESNDKDKTTDLPNSDDITEKPVTSRAPLRRSNKTKIPKGSVKSFDGEIFTGLPNLADNTEKPVTSRVPLRHSTRTTKSSVQFDQSTRAKHTIKRVKMGNKQSEPTVSKSSQEELTKCCDNVDFLEELLTHYSDGTRVLAHPCNPAI